MGRKMSGLSILTLALLGCQDAKQQPVRTTEPEPEYISASGKLSSWEALEAMASRQRRSSGNRRKFLRIFPRQGGDEDFQSQ